MNVERNIVDGLPVLSLSDAIEIDVANGGEFKQRFAEQLEESDRRVVFDASSVGFFDSAGMGCLLSLHKLLKGRDGELILAGLSRTVAEVFHMVGLDVVFRVFDDVEDAVASLREPPG